MISQGEQRLKRKLFYKRRNSVDFIRKRTSPHVEYQDKMQYIEREIDRDMTYF